ncbi:MAG TPA: bifunctional acetate--CoA ligase family protein/GNAT family N-acetyltransferase [Chthoniobacteraceae bacterium]|jgi:acetyltransferase|nr:bifunctional acetate--CoA ligase family protein/GNAT family N-acetyltransferase [Chthoniobacteraceae bacterium]
MSTITLSKPKSARRVARARQRPILDAMFTPASVALIGATETEGSVGRTVLQNLSAHSFGGAIYPVNPKRPTVLGHRAYKSVTEIGSPVDLAVICTPAATVPGIIAECAAAHVRGAVVISAGFKETGPAGAELEREVLRRAGPMRIIGPNCLGIMNPIRGLNATFAADIAKPGHVAFISQSGALCTAILDWSLKENVGFSSFISIGSMADVGWGDLIYHLGDDPATRSIIIYMESIGNARSFLSAAREVALSKPIIVIKTGRTEAAARAAASHTGSLTGSDEVLDAAFRRVGVLRVDSIGELFDMAEILGKQPRTRGSRLAIVTNAGGPGGLAADALSLGGGELAPLSQETFGALNEMLPPHWSHNNPVDVLGDASPERYGKVTALALEDANTDGVLVILTPQAMTDATETARELKNLTGKYDKPLLAAWMGGPAVEKGEDILNAGNIPSFKYPDRAARAFTYMWKYSDNLRALYETPSLAPIAPPDRARAAELIGNARSSGREILTEFESKNLLAAYGIPVVPTRLATSPAEAAAIATEFGFPVVIKLSSETITHKSDVGGVRLNLRDRTAVAAAYEEMEKSVTAAFGAAAFAGVTVQPMISAGGIELILGSSPDPQFGPVLLFGAGGKYVEIIKDRSLGLPPLTATLARRMMERTRIFKALAGVRGQKPSDLPALDHLMVRFSQLVAEQRWIKEIDINPLVATEDGGFIALDARVIVYGAKTAALPAAAIRPYPAQYVSYRVLRDGSKAAIRPIRPEDEPLMVDFHKTLSDATVHFRYFGTLKLEQRIAHERLTRICFNDYDREIALAVEREKPGGGREILGIGRLSRTLDDGEAEFAILVSDPWQRQGIGTELLEKLVAIAKQEGMSRISGCILPGNTGMERICRNVGMQIAHATDGEMWAELALKTKRTD